MVWSGLGAFFIVGMKLMTKKYIYNRLIISIVILLYLNKICNFIVKAFILYNSLLIQHFFFITSPFPHFAIIFNRKFTVNLLIYGMKDVEYCNFSKNINL